MMELESDRLARGNARYSLNNAAYNVEWDEKKHPRGKDGKFGPGGSSGKAKEKAPEKKEKITDLNPTGGVFVDYTPSQRAEMELGENMTTLAETSGGDPDEIVTVYRGIESGDGSINPGDFITTNKQLAQDYAGTGKVVSLDIRLGDILDDSDEPLGEEYLYYPEKKKENSCKPRRFRLMNTAYNTDFDESKHPRGADGKFGTGGTGKKTEKKEKADKTTGGAKDKEKKQGAAKVESRGDKKGQPRQPANDIKEIYRLTAASSKPFSEFVNKYAEKYGGTVISRPELKSIERVKQKLAEDPGKGYNGIVDIDAKTIVVPDLDAMDSLYGELLADNSVIRAKNRFANPTESGYRDILSNVKMPNGAIVELQVSTPEMMDAKDVCHSLYEVERELAIGIENGRATQKEFSVWDKLQKIQEKVYGAAWAASTSAASFSASSLVMTEAQYLKSVETILGSGFNDLSDKTRKHFKELLSTAYGNPSESKNLSPGDSTLKSAISLPSNSIVIHRVKNSKPPDRKIRYFRVK